MASNIKHRDRTIRFFGVLVDPLFARSAFCRLAIICETKLVYISIS